MGVLKAQYETVKVRFENGICFLQMHRPEAGNTISTRLVEECADVVRFAEEHATILVLEGLPEVFCWGADFGELAAGDGEDRNGESPAAALYDLWLSLAFGSFVSVAHVRGKANAGGLGFVAACDIVVCADTVMFSLSELLFGLMPACVLPFLTRKVGPAKSNYITLMTQPFTAEQAVNWGLVDVSAENSENLLRRHLLRLRYLPKTGVTRYKKYLRNLDDLLLPSRDKAVAANEEVFSDEDNLRKIERYVKTGQFPWEGE
ncbi:MULTISPECIES: enoyl-CoA hydratase/isomerase [unclassified Streptomyces]|uniref:enoyl-CoA hydratase/isomerase n=1 Tax=unclassified Streptomyces TaxID=2593676 RepID=UPI001BECEDE0|nr:MULTISPECIES: enoyl-CoA hydratase/isomerase [unclassified Streptomyces]MBT2404436.1 enoyl-CoA hydratase/isomerase [Streptomyces sp. ISL-21]MBT2612510.1 enoyl-CoA hydratase/isomerase [Streptomyces sp. ISL-87]